MGARILIVEDNPVNLELMVYLLRASGHATIIAFDGPEGMDIAFRERPDLVVLDLHLPTMDGYEVACRLKADASTRSIPIVAVTALAMTGEREKALAAGFDGYLSKPITPESFVHELEEFLPRDRRGTVRSRLSKPEGAET